MTDPSAPHTSPTAPLPAVASSPIWLLLLLSLGMLLAWDHSGLDLPLARWFGSPTGFAYESHWFWRGVLHEKIHWLPWMVEATLLVGAAWPFGSLKSLELARRLQLALTTLAALAVVSIIKTYSWTSCPWDLSEFGGTALYVSHWAWQVHDGGSGGCFPAGHASAGFAFLGGFFAFRHSAPAASRRWLLAAMTTGLVLGLAQQVRGAHYMSHTLWTAWICWAVAASIDSAVSLWISQRQSPAPIPAP